MSMPRTARAALPVSHQSMPALIEALTRLSKRVLPGSRLETRGLTQQRFELSLEATEDSVAERAGRKSLDMPTVLFLKEEFAQRECKRGLVRFDD